MKRILLTLAILAIGSVAVWFGLKGSQPAEVNIATGELTVSSSLVDFGDINQSGGVVSAAIEVSNTGEGGLEIHRVSTSCGCTTATMDTSPLAPGEQRILTVAFDPMVHPDQSGPITRVVYIQSSDPDMSEVEIDVVGNVVPTDNL